VMDSPEPRPTRARIEDRRPEGADRDPPSTLDVARFRLKPSGPLRTRAMRAG
jgi:hypothetical protein